jgi:hypothetical protein
MLKLTWVWHRLPAAQMRFIGRARLFYGRNGKLGSRDVPSSAAARTGRRNEYNDEGARRTCCCPRTRAHVVRQSGNYG